MAVVLLAANLPRLWVSQRSGSSPRQFVGQFWGGYDLPQYTEAIHEGMQGAWQFAGRTWSAEPGAHYVFHLQYLLAGHLFGGFAWGEFAILELLRWAFQVSALAAAVLFVRTAVPPGRRAWALFFATLAGGLGWLVLGQPSTPLGPVIPMDLATPAFDLLNTFQTAPHVALFFACAAVFGWGFLRTAGGDARGLLAVPAAALALTIHPFDLLPAVAAAGITAVLLARTRYALALVAAVVAMGLLEAGYLLSLSAAHDLGIANQAAASSTTEVGDIPGVLVSRVFLLPLAVIALAQLRRERAPGLVFLGLWAVLATLLNLLPLDPGGPLHRSLEGSSLAFGALAAMGLPGHRARWLPYLAGACLVSPVLQAAALLLNVESDRNAWVSRSVIALAGRVDHDRLQGSVADGGNGGARWLIGLTDLRYPADRPPDYLVVEPRAAVPDGWRVVESAGDADLLGR